MGFTPTIHDIGCMWIFEFHRIPLSSCTILLDPFGLDLENLRQGGLSKSCVSVKVPAEPLSLEVLIQHLHTLEKKLGLSLAQLHSAGIAWLILI